MSFLSFVSSKTMGKKMTTDHYLVEKMTANDYRNEDLTETR